ncbi:MAG TPA: SidA/IucD/PvdA family monooxygenase [Niabella sp.]|nr:SidA/IucD/PvdA family monooxygenase [Niabella sp.]
MQNKIYDLVGIGIGPFNLGLAAMLQDHSEINAVFVDQKKSFDWHPGIALPWVRIQVPYFADLVTLANPQSQFTYINYLKQTQQLFRFGAQENIFPLRVEYNNYCKWVADQLPDLIFSHRCEKITYHEQNNYYTVHCTHNNLCNKTFHAKRLVIGVGTVPCLPEGINLNHNIIHSGDYLNHKSEILQSKNVTIVGSGQSAAEIYYDLLQQADQFSHLHWFTRSRHLAPMDYSRFALEMASPDYIDYFFSLPEKAKAEILASQAYLYKGINRQLIEQIHDQLYIIDAQGGSFKPNIYTSLELAGIQHVGKSLHLYFHHRDTGKQFTQTTGSVILATGYQYKVPAFLKSIRDRINWNANGWFRVQKQYTVDDHQTIFVQNADLHSHGFNAADLGLGVHRNMDIINGLLKQDYYTIERNTTFQKLEPSIL